MAIIQIVVLAKKKEKRRGVSCSAMQAFNDRLLLQRERKKLKKELLL